MRRRIIRDPAAAYLRPGTLSDDQRMNSPATPLQPTPAERLAKLREVVKHLAGMWAVVLQRLTYLQMFTSSDELWTALNQTRAAHVHNAIQDVLLGDLILQLAALILDRDSGSASVSRAISMLRDESVLEQLRASYREVAEPARIYGGDELGPDARAATVRSLREWTVQKRLEECATLCSRLPEIETTLVKSPTAAAISRARKKAVAHYDLHREGGDWRVWRVGDVGLTYGQLVDYTEASTLAIHLLYRLVLRCNHDFASTRGVAERYGVEYISALTDGLRRQRWEG